MSCDKKTFVGLVLIFTYGNLLQANEEGGDWAGEDIDITLDEGAIIAVDNGEFGFLKIQSFLFNLMLAFHMSFESRTLDGGVGTLCTSVNKMRTRES